MFHHRVTTVAGKRSRSFCRKCRWQVTAKHTCTLRMWFCMKWHGCMVYTERAETAAVSCGTSHASAVSTPLWRSCDDSFHWWMIFLNSFSAILSLQWPRHTINCHCVPTVIECLCSTSSSRSSIDVLQESQSSGAVWKSRWPSWSPLSLIVLMASVDVAVQPVASPLRYRYMPHTVTEKQLVLVECCFTSTGTPSL